MKLRVFATFSLLGLGLPLLAGSSWAQQTKPPPAAPPPAVHQTFQVRRVLIEDVQGNRNRLDFDNPLVNIKAPPSAFVFTPPPGTQIIQPSGAQALPSSGAPAPQP